MKINVTFNVEQWSNIASGWSADVLSIPGAEVEAVYAGGKEVLQNMTTVDEAAKLIRWTGRDDAPSSIMVTISIPDDLTSKGKEEKLRLVSIIVTSIVSILSAMFVSWIKK